MEPISFRPVKKAVGGHRAEKLSGLSGCEKVFDKKGYVDDTKRTSNFL